MHYISAGQSAPLGQRILNPFRNAVRDRPTCENGQRYPLRRFRNTAGRLPHSTQTSTNWGAPIALAPTPGTEHICRFTSRLPQWISAATDDSAYGLRGLLNALRGRSKEAHYDVSTKVGLAALHQRKPGTTENCR